MRLTMGLVLLIAAALPAFAQPRPATILLVGANGMIGSRILAEAAARGHTVLAASREPDKIAKGPHIEPIKLDAADRDAFIAAARKADVIVMATSTRSAPDAFAEAEKLAANGIAAAKASGKRLVLVGGSSGLTLPDGRPALDVLPANLHKGEPVAKRAILDMLKASDVDWTVVSPALTISPGEHTRTYRLGGDTVLFDAKGVSRISAEDFADALVGELEKPAHRHQQMTVAY